MHHNTLQWHTSGIPRLPKHKTTKYGWGGARNITTPSTMHSQASKHQNYTICPKQHHSSLRATCKVPTTSQMCQIRYVAEAIQKLYKHEQKDNTKEFHIESSTTSNLAKNTSFQGQWKFQILTSCLCSEAFWQHPNKIYRTPNGMKIDRELDK